MSSDDAVLDRRTPGTHWLWPSADQDRAALPVGEVDLDLDLLRRVRRGLKAIGNDVRKER